MLQKIVLGFGSNIGNREKYIKDAVKILSQSRNFFFIAISDIYESKPWGFKNQNDFLNCAGVFLYRASPVALLQELKDLEQNLGRTNRKKWHPREIDIDLLFFGDKIINQKKLIVPHPQIRFRNFVLKPLARLMPNYVHPVFKTDIIGLYRNSTDKDRVTLHNNIING